VNGLSDEKKPLNVKEILDKLEFRFCDSNYPPQTKNDESWVRNIQCFINELRREYGIKK
jgi:hypothetical protein